MKRYLLFGLVLAACLCPSGTRSESVFDRRDRRAAYLFVDNRGRQIGDVLTLVINENTDIDQKENRALDKSSKAGGKWSFASAWTDGSADKAAGGSFQGDASSNRSFDGEANFSSQRDMSDRMTVEIIDVLPNGYVVIEGFRTRIISGEERTMRVSGLVRPADVSVTNLVQSQFVAKMKISYVGKGVDSRFVNQGWFSRAMNKLWPF